IKYTGHYIDHELVVNIEEDCKRRIDKINNGRPLAVLLTIGGAGAQQEIFMEIIKFLSEYIKEKKVTLYVNVGDYHKVWDAMSKKMPILKEATTHFDNWSETRKFAAKALEEDVYGIHSFCHSDIFEAVYATNLLMRSCDLLVTKPSELAFYPVPKLFIQRVGGHERWGAIHAAEIGDGTIECDSVDNAINMLKLLMNDKSLLEVMNTNIIANKSRGIYNGAYEVVKLATKSM
ncbi:MAG: hypothetical protein K6G26_02115, partial [Lachnospiraceae bacterium]|nr:hypothetical protein [Lachnospiraceae bacterium]